MTASYQKDYPRPMFVRKDWTNLNGEWDFAFDDDLAGWRKGWANEFPKGLSIRVPFTYETEMSGIGDETHHPAVWYHRTLILPVIDPEKERQLLHLEGCDYETEIYVNGVFIKRHTGGYARISADITDAVREGENDIVVAARDSMDTSQPRGKQRWWPVSVGCWYVQTTGIWKTVWTERVGAVRIDSVKITPSVLDARIEFEFAIEGASPDLTVEAVLKESSEIKEALIAGHSYRTDDGYTGRTVTRCAVSAADRRTSATLYMQGEDHRGWGLHTWKPGDPYLYDLEFYLRRDGEILDEVRSYVGFRDVSCEKGNVCLNGAPLYQRLILDQGYWPESGLTPPSEEALIEDIDKTLALGYNGVRKHQKVEDERYLYWADVKGLLVWSEMAAAYDFTDDAVQQFTEQWMEIVRQNYNHPSIITWTPFNESWGFRQLRARKDEQAFADGIYYLTHAFDRNRPVIGNDGWEQTKTDVVTWHNYEESGDVLYERYHDHLPEILDNTLYHTGNRKAFASDHPYEGQAVLVTEFGGIAFSSESGWGYGNQVKDEETFLARFDKVTTAIKKLPYVSGYCYTQLTDVQQEVNGLLDENRNYKINPEKIREINLRKVGVRFRE